MRAGCFIGFSALMLCAALPQGAAAAPPPPYRPERQVSGLIRNYGFGLGGALKAWEAAFARYQPNVRFTDTLPTSDAAFPGLVTYQADLGFDGGEPAITEELSFQETRGYHESYVVIASGSFDVEGKSNGPVVFVNAANPISSLSVDQLDGIFGAERNGSLEGYVWTPVGARGPEKNIRRWGQLGLGGEWAKHPIQTYGHGPSGTTRFFQLRVLGNSDKWNPNYREYVESGSKQIADVDKVEQRLGARWMLSQELAHDRYGIAWSTMSQARGMRGVKMLAIAPRGGGTAVIPSQASFRDRTYPLVRNIYVYFDRKPGSDLAPRLKEFLRFILSPEGQQIAEQSGYLPLPPEMLKEQLRKLD
jgi:phosphate transport system substrate-binding protein